MRKLEELCFTKAHARHVEMVEDLGSRNVAFHVFHEELVQHVVFSVWVRVLLRQFLEFVIAQVELTQAVCAPVQPLGNGDEESGRQAGP